MVLLFKNHTHSICFSVYNKNYDNCLIKFFTLILCHLIKTNKKVIKTNKNERNQSNSKYLYKNLFHRLYVSWYNVHVGVEKPIFFFTPPPKDPQTFSRNFHLNRNKLGISMLFLSDFSIILKTVTCALIN